MGTALFHVIPPFRRRYQKGRRTTDGLVVRLPAPWRPLTIRADALDRRLPSQSLASEMLSFKHA